MRAIGYIVKKKVESRKVLKYFFSKGFKWKYGRSGDWDIIIGDRGSVIYEDYG